jgi:lipopolysaccharide export system protein LptC|tara:strand:+ start:2222 stop:4015 length:1794 start_codon:yes stop_codon:yes gene_type:complete
MGQIREINIAQFNGGISTDERSPQANVCRHCEHFDIYTSPYKLIPYRDTEADDDTGGGAGTLDTYDVKHFQLGLNGSLYAIGVSGSTVKVLSKADPTTGNWTVESNASVSARIDGAFIEWQSKFWFFTGTNKLTSWTISGSTFTDEGTVGTITSVAQGVLGPDNNLYMFYDNKVVRVSSASAEEDDVFTAIPSDMRITSATRYGAYLAIGCSYGTSNTASPAGVAKVFLWDYATTGTAADVLDFGEGNLNVLGNVEGSLIGVLDKYMEKSTVGDDLSVGQGTMVVKRWAGGIVRTVKELQANQSVTLGRMLKDKVEKDNKLYWVASVPYSTSTSTESTYNLGIWSFGRKDSNSELALSLDYIEANIATANYKIVSFGAAGNYWFINHSNDGSVHKTNDVAAYTTTSLYETQVFGDGHQTNKLKGVSLSVDSLKRTATMTIASPAVVTLTAHGFSAGDSFFFTTSGALPTGVSANTKYYVLSSGLTADAFQFATAAGGTAIVSTGSQSGTHTAHSGKCALKYKKDGELSWTTIFDIDIDSTFDNNNVPAFRRKAINIESSGTTLPDYREIEFRIESTKGMAITGLRIRIEEITDGLYG